MISLIICSRHANIDPELEENIAATIGVPYEIVRIDNSTGKYGICEAYNYGAEQSRYDILCFMHDDIRYHTTGWGQVAAETAVLPGAGVIGVAGAVVRTRVPSPWWISNFYDAGRYWRCNLLQYRGQNRSTAQDLVNPYKEKLSRVVLLDGVWLCCKKTVWADIKFDVLNMPGFHFYDLDFSFAAGTSGYSNFVSYDILIEHRSAGTLGREWLEAADRFFSKWKAVPATAVGKIPADEEKELEFQAIRNYLFLASQYKHGNRQRRLEYWFRSLSLKSLQKEHLRLLKHALLNS